MISGRVVSALGAVTVASLTVVALWLRNRRNGHAKHTSPCNLFSEAPEQLTCQSTKREVMGLALLDDRMYTVTVFSASVYVYQTEPPYNRLEDIPVDGMINPHDLASCTETKRLYVVDELNRWIWRVSLTGSADKLVPTECLTSSSVSPCSVSVTAGNALVTMRRNGMLLYSREGELLATIKLQEYMNPRHAILTRQGTYLVCHEGWRRDVKHDQISELDANGALIRAYGGVRGHSQAQLDEAQHMAVDSVGHVIVADHNNHRVIVLSPELEMERILLTMDNHDLVKPWRLSFDETSGTLLVSEFGPHRFRMFSIC